MSRIITVNYYNKINALIGEYKISPDLSTLVDFYFDEVRIDQIKEGSRNLKIFSTANLKKVQEIKESKDLRKLYAYLNLIIEAFSGQYLHIHINKDFPDDMISNIASCFVWQALQGGSYDASYLKKEKIALKNKIGRHIMVSSDAGAHAINKLRREKKVLRFKRKLIEQIRNKKNENGVLLNLNVGAAASVNFSEDLGFPESLNTHVNFGNNLQKIYDEKSDVLQKTTTILNLFPAIKGQNIWYGDFIKENIDAWNQFPEFNFTKVVTITQGEKSTENLLNMKKENRFQANEIYTIFSFEL